MVTAIPRGTPSLIPCPPSSLRLCPKSSGGVVDNPELVVVVVVLVELVVFAELVKNALIGVDARERCAVGVDGFAEDDNFVGEVGCIADNNLGGVLVFREGFVLEGVLPLDGVDSGVEIDSFIGEGVVARRAFGAESLARSENVPKTSLFSLFSGENTFSAWIFSFSLSFCLTLMIFSFSFLLFGDTGPMS